MHMEGLSGEREVRFAKRLRLGRVRVDELRYVSRQRFPVVDELTLGDQLTDPGTHQVDAQDRARLAGRPAAGGGDDLRRPLGLQDDALAVPAEVVGVLR